MNPDTDTAAQVKFRIWKEAGIWLLFLVFFLLLFLQFPLAGSLPGKVDSWYHLAIFNWYQNEAFEWLGGPANGSPYYPAVNMLRYGEPEAGNAILFLLIKIFIRNPLWNFYVFIALLFSLNAFAVYRLASGLGMGGIAAITAGFFFGTSCYLFGQLDHANTLAWFPAIFALRYLYVFLNSGRAKSAGFFLLLSAVQIWFSGYVFVYLMAMSGILFLLNLKAFLQRPRPDVRSVVIPFSVALCILLPYLFFFAGNPDLVKSFNPGRDFHGAEWANLKASDLFRSLPNNLMYGCGNFWEYPLLYSIRSANLGVLLWLLAVGGLIYSRRQRAFSIFLILAGFAFSFGPCLEIGALKIPSLLYPFYQWGWLDMLRTPVRAFGMVVLGLSLLAAFFLDFRILSHTKWKWMLPALLLFFLLENCPFPFQKYDSWRYMKPDEGWVSAIRGKGKVMVELPSAIFQESHDMKGALDETSREHVYAWWQTFHRLNIPNGSSGYFPESRMIFNRLAATGNAVGIIEMFNPDFLVWHKHLYLSFETAEPPLVPESGRRIYEDSLTVVWAFHP